MFLLASIVVWLYDTAKEYDYPSEYQLNINEFTFLEQPDGVTCGPTCVAMLVSTYGKETTVEEVRRFTKTDWFEWGDVRVGMTVPEYMPKGMEKLGLPAKLKYGSLSHLKYYLSKGYPPIVLLRSGKQTWHYVVFIGYDDLHVYLADPSWGKKISMDIEVFLKAWDFSGDMGSNEYDSGTDLLRNLLKWVEIHGNTYIVPSEKLEEK